jgi:AcrR family transcriptional regulator
MLSASGQTHPGWAAIIEAGGKDISLREIARRAGVSSTASFHHFRNKEALLVAVAVEGFERLTATLRKRVESIDDPTERLRIVLRTYIEFGRFVGNYPSVVSVRADLSAGAGQHRP